MSVDTWATPKPVSDAQRAFPARLGPLLPPWDEIPDEFKRSRNTWVEFQAEWMFFGLGKPEFRLRDGIDGDLAVRHLSTIQRSFEPKHEHKEAAVAYLASLWFKSVTANGKTFGEVTP